jgi:hypothetical protein
MVYFSLESDIDRLQTIKPDIMGDFVFSLSPDALLLIESGLIRREILQMNLGMSLEEKSDFFPFMPFSPIYKEIDHITAEGF